MKKKSKVEDALMALAIVWKSAEDKAVPARLPEYGLKNLEFTKTISATIRGYVEEDMVFVDVEFMKELEVDEFKLVVKIMSDLMRNNALWFFDYRAIGGRPERAYLSLRKKGLFLDIGTTDMHIINPFLLRKGNVSAVIATTWDIIERKKELSPKLIKHLRTPKQTQISAYYASLL